jgi:hypothetical protein
MYCILDYEYSFILIIYFNIQTMRRIFTIILLILVFSQIYAQSNPTAGLKKISLAGLNTGDGHIFHQNSSDGKLNNGFSEVFIAITDKNIGAQISSKGNVIAKSSAIRKNVTSLAGKSTASNDTITQIGWFIDRDCVAPSGTWNLPHTSSCGVDCTFTTSDNCWNSGLGVFIYNPNESGQISRDSALTDKHYLLLDVQSKELMKAFLLSLPDSVSGEYSVKVKGYWNTNGISSNKTETLVPELIADSVDHYLKSFHLYSIEGIYIETLPNSYSGFGTNSYKLVPEDLAPKNVSAINFTGGATVRFTPPGSVGNPNSNVTGYKVRVYSKTGVVQDSYTTIVNDTSVTSIPVPGFTATLNNTFTVSALYSGSTVEVESTPSNVIDTSSGIKNTITSSISVYPTLSQGVITIISPAEATIKVLDYTGKTIETYQSSGSKTINLNVPSGLYLVNVESAGETSVQKVIIRK